MPSFRRVQKNNGSKQCRRFSVASSVIGHKAAGHSGAKISRNAGGLPKSGLYSYFFLDGVGLLVVHWWPLCVYGLFTSF